MLHFSDVQNSRFGGPPDSTGERGKTVEDPSDSTGGRGEKGKCNILLSYIGSISRGFRVIFRGNGILLADFSWSLFERY